MSTPEHTWKSANHRTPVGVRQWRVSDDESLPANALALHPAYRALIACGTLAFFGVVCWLLLMLVAGPPTSHVVMIGITEYRNGMAPLNDFGRQDMEGLERGLGTVNTLLSRRQFALRGAQGGGSEQDEPETAAGSDNNLNSESYARVFQDLNSLDGIEDANVLVFCSLHARVDPVAQGTCRLMFLNSDGTSSTGEVKLADLLAQLVQLRAGHVFLFIDANRLTSDWDLGVLSNQFTRCLKSEIAKIDTVRLTVFCAADSGQRSWTDERARMSIFFHEALRALSGDADGWGDGPLDNVVDSREVFGFVAHQVEEWVRANRGQSQTVLRLGSEANIPLAVNVGGQQRLAAFAAEQAAAKAAAAESNTDDDQGQKPASDATTTQPSPADTAQTKASTDTAQAKTDADLSGAADDAALAAGPTLAQAKRQLAMAWKLRDAWQQDGHLALFDPALWQFAQSELIRCQELLRHGEYAAVVDRVEQLESRVAQVGALVDGRWTASGDPSTPSSLAALIPRPSRTGSPAEATSASEPDPAVVKQQALLAAMIDEYLQAPAEPPPDLVAVSRLVRSQSTAMDHLISEIPLRAQQVGNCRPAVLKRLRALIDLVPQTRRNSCLTCISRFADLVGVDPGQLDTSCRAVLAQRSAVEALLFDLLQAPHIASYVEAEFAATIRELNAAQRWLLLTDGRVPMVPNTDGQPKIDFVERHLRQCANEIKITREVFARVDEALRLRAEILSELPALTRWTAQVAEADSSAGLPPPAAQRQDLLAVWQAALNHMRDVDELLKNTELSTEEILRQVARRTGDLKFRFEGLRKAWQNELSELTAGELQAADWSRVDRALKSPWMTAETRLRLVALRESGTVVTSGVDRATLDERERGQTVPGIWQAWWAMQMLDVNGRDTEIIRRNWQAWKTQTPAADGDADAGMANLVAAARVGTDLRRELRAVARDVTAEQRDPAILSQLYIAGLTEDRLSRARRVSADAVGSRQLLSTYFSGFRGELDSEQRPDTIRSYQQRFQRMLVEMSGNTLTANTWNAEPEPQLSGGLRRDGPSQGVVGLQLKMDVPDGQAERRVRMLALCNIASLDRQGRLPAAGRESGLQQVSGLYRVAYTTQDMIDVPQADLTVAVLDVETGFPLTIWRDQLQRPSEPNKWRVVFRAEKDPDDSRNATKPRQTVVTLPVSPPKQPHVLRAYLIKPEADSSVAKVAVTVWALDSDGQRRLLAENAPIDVAGPALEPRLIQLPQVAPMTGKQPTDKKTTQPMAAQGIDLSNGLVMQIKPTAPLDKPAFEYVVLFDVLRPIEHLKQEPELTFTDDQLTVTVERRPLATADVLLPEEIPVRLRLAKRVDQRRSDNSLLRQSLNAENPIKTVYAGFDVEVLDELQRRPFDVMLDVGGIPHGFRWRDVQPGSRGELQRGDDLWLEIQEPVDGAIFDGKGDIPLQVKLDGSELRVPIIGNAQKPWKLRYRLSPEGARDDPRKGLSGETFIVRRPRKSTFHLRGLAKGDWQIAVDVRDFVWPNVRPPQSGTFVLETTLQRGSSKLSRESQFVIDSSPPIAETIGKLPEAVNVRDQTLDLRLKAGDLQSGIQEVIAVFDLDNDRKIGEDERRAAFVNRNLWRFQPLENGKDRPVQPLIKIPLPKQAGKTYHLLLQATNGAGTVGKMLHGDVELKPAKVRLEVRTNIAPNDRYRWIVLDATGKPYEDEPPRNNQRSPQTFELPVGKYTIKVDGRRVGARAISITDKDWQPRRPSNTPDKRIVIPVTIK